MTLRLLELLVAGVIVMVKVLELKYNVIVTIVIYSFLIRCFF